MTEDFKTWVAEEMNRLPEVTWDRMTSSDHRTTVFGWIPRDDFYKDFITLTFDNRGMSFTTSSAKWSEEFGKRYGVSEHRPCTRVEEVFGDEVKSVKVADPTTLGGDSISAEGDGEVTTSVVNLERAVLVDGMAVVAVQLDDAVAIGLLLEGEVNQTHERARVLNLMRWEDVAGVVAELEGLASRMGYLPELETIIRRRWEKLKEEGAA